MGYLEQIGLVVEVADHLHGFVAALLVGLLQDSVENIRRDAREFQLHTCETTGLGDAQGRRVLSTHGIRNIIDDVANQNAVPLRERKRQHSIVGRGFPGGLLDQRQLWRRGGRDRFGGIAHGLVTGSESGTSRKSSMGGSNGRFTPGMIATLSPRFCCCRSRM